MLEVTILKVVHEKLVEAKKLPSFIAATDIFSPENANDWEKEVRDTERLWTQLLETNASIATFKRIFDPLLQSRNPNVRLYAVKKMEMIYRQKKPIIYLERWSLVDSLRLRAKYNTAINRYVAAINAFGQVELNTVIQESFYSLKDQAAVFQERDKHIAQTLTRAEELAHETYPGLKTIDQLRLTLAIGAAHRPERYFEKPVTIVDLRSEGDKREDILNVFRNIQDHAISFEDAKRDVLSIVLAEVGHLSEAASEGKTYEELREIALKAYKTKTP